MQYCVHRSENTSTRVDTVLYLLSSRLVIVDAEGQKVLSSHTEYDGCDASYYSSTSSNTLLESL